jgi:hypothetical protein
MLLLLAVTQIISADSGCRRYVSTQVDDRQIAVTLLLVGTVAISSLVWANRLKPATAPVEWYAGW